MHQEGPIMENYTREVILETLLAACIVGAMLTFAGLIACFL